MSCILDYFDVPSPVGVSQDLFLQCDDEESIASRLDVEL